MPKEIFAAFHFYEVIAENEPRHLLCHYGFSCLARLAAEIRGNQFNSDPRKLEYIYRHCNLSETKLALDIII